MRLTLPFATAAAATTAPYEGWPLPEYCMPPNEMSKYKIPPLDVTSRSLALVHTQVIARHGARAPYYRIFCWDEAPSPVNAIWNCSTSSVWSEDIMAGDDGGRGFGRLYKKQYLDGENILSGTCSVGGLLPLGREQHRQLGQLLQDAYVGDGPLKLFTTTTLRDIPASAIYLRSDDQERTLGSGQALVDGLFPYAPTDDADTEDMLTWMTADGATDYIDHKNDNSCPVLAYITSQANASAAWQANALDATQLEADFEAIVGGRFSWDTCNDIPLPEGMTPAMFDALVRQVELRKKLVLTFQDAWYAKVDMHRMWVDVLARIDTALSHAATSPKLFVTIAHDSTIMPMLAGLLGDSWDGAWTTYAGTLLLELYKDTALEDEGDNEEAYAVRVLYNGQPLQLPFCEDVLCDWKAFNHALAFARRDRQCDIPSSSTSLLRHPMSPSTNELWTLQGPHWFAAGVVLCGCVALTTAMLRQVIRHRSINSPETRPLFS
ncbi:Aste57867_11894 [Aphanomyces stellatus]|uniref:Aste57867_11894 protein n=1 Tax=Aphanomyces stellatus TaxID=120398 RepID=A0A485KU91_9STRA|nr:hypothetical protein As57867_011849 [Aphanomyces stellatus]VFT88749.1 Aste57867_11894 [Aphanomyces stellatus]